MKRFMLAMMACVVLTGCREAKRQAQTDQTPPPPPVAKKPFPITKPEPDPAFSDKPDPIVVTAPENVVDAITQMLGSSGEFPNKKEMVINAGEGTKIKVPVGFNFTYSIQADGSYLFILGRPKPEVSVKQMRWLIEPPLSSVLIKRNNTGVAKVDMPGGMTYPHKFKIDWDSGSPSKAPEKTQNDPLPAVEIKDKLSVIIATAPAWCDPCKVAQKHTIPKLKDRGIDVKEIDADKTDVSLFDVKDLPTFILYVGEAEVGRVVGQEPVSGSTNKTLDKILDLFKKK